jgi:hypothetical protein
MSCWWAEKQRIPPTLPPTPVAKRRQDVPVHADAASTVGHEDSWMNTLTEVSWEVDWVWSLPLIAMNVVIHVFCLGLFTEKVEHAISRLKDRRQFRTIFAMVMSVAVTFATILHGVEGAIWAAAYWFIGAMPDGRSAMLYSLSAMTSYGHANLFLESRWQLMGALEALNGMLLFGLSTAFLFAMIQRVWPVGNRGRSRADNSSETHRRPVVPG